MLYHFKMQQLRFGDVKELAKDYTDCKSWSWDSLPPAEADCKPGVQDLTEGQAGHFCPKGMCACGTPSIHPASQPASIVMLLLDQAFHVQRANHPAHRAVLPGPFHGQQTPKRGFALAPALWDRKPLPLHRMPTLDETLVEARCLHSLFTKAQRHRVTYLRSHSM